MFVCINKMRKIKIFHFSKPASSPRLSEARTSGKLECLKKPVEFLEKNLRNNALFFGAGSGDAEEQAKAVREIIDMMTPVIVKKGEILMEQGIYIYIYICIYKI